MVRRGVKSYVRRKLATKKRFIKRVKDALAADWKYKYYIRSNTWRMICAQDSQEVVPEGNNVGFEYMFSRGDCAGVTAMCTGDTQADIVVKKAVYTFVIGHTFVSSVGNNPVAPAHCDVYVVRCRKSPDTNDSVNTNQAWTPQLAFKYGFGAQQTDTGQVLYTNEWVDPYMNKWFCNYFKIIRKKSFVLAHGAYKSFHLTQRNVRFKNGIFNGDSSLAAIPKAYNILIVLKGPLARWGSANTVNGQGRSTAAILIRATRKYKFLDTLGSLENEPRVDIENANDVADNYALSSLQDRTDGAQ